MTVPLLVLVGVLSAEPYKHAPKEISDIVRAAATPQDSVSPARTHMLLLDNERYPPIAELSQPMLRLAGHRMNPATNGPHMEPSYTGATLVRFSDLHQARIALPKGTRIGWLEWSGDGRYAAFTNTVGSRIELWVIDVTSALARAVPGITLNAAFSDPLQWLPNNNTLLVQTIPAGRGKPPAPPMVPDGPTTQQSLGKAGPVRTYQDLLQNPHDEALFEYYATSQLMRVNLDTGHTTAVGKPAVFYSLDPSPDGKLILQSKVERPYSYLLPAQLFPRTFEIVETGTGRIVHMLAKLPLADRIPIEGVRTGPRSLAWRPNEPATLAWVEALDGGNPKEKVPHRDRVVQLRAPFQGEPVELAKLEHRSGFGGMGWTARGEAWVTDYDRNKRWMRTFLLQDTGVKTIFSRNIQDRYGDPGAPVWEVSKRGQRVMHQDGDSIFLTGLGASPKGDRPFLDRYNLKTSEKMRIFQCDDESYETVEAVLSKDGRRLLTRRESPTDPPNYFLHDGDKRTAITAFRDPAPRLRGVTKQQITYKRADGAPLSMTLYLPPDYKPGTRLPTVMWAYPREFTDAATAGQIAGSAKRFTTITGPSHLFLLLAGYAIIDDPSLPVIGDSETMNNTYLEQIVAGAKAAIDKVDEMGVVDRNRVGVGGHSYGAFMTANLLAHTDLFRAGVARSGAYNRTLTPFGFQSERRTIWEAPDVYLKMSPFLSAHKINKPILMIHGEADDNQGTFPIQSERMYQAIRGNGGTVRLVMLPHEAHGYRGQESIEHVLAETIEWFDRYVKAAE